MLPVGTPTSDISDAHPSLQICETPLTDYGGRTRFGGRIRTLRCRDDTALLMKVLSEPGEGCVLVVDGDASRRCALLGDRHGGMAVTNGWSGLIINGAVRDVEGLARLNLGVRALGPTPRRSGKSGLGEVDEPVEFGSAEFRPGGFLWCDVDGIVVAPPDWESDVLEPVPQEGAFRH
jgi:regulator of ribonuclease activity A